MSSNETSADIYLYPSHCTSVPSLEHDHEGQPLPEEREKNDSTSFVPLYAKYRSSRGFKVCAHFPHCKEAQKLTLTNWFK